MMRKLSKARTRTGLVSRTALAGVFFLTTTAGAWAQTAPPGVSPPSSSTTVTAPTTTVAAPPTSSALPAMPTTTSGSSTSGSSSSFPSISTMTQSPCPQTVASSTTSSSSSSSSSSAASAAATAIASAPVGTVGSLAAPLVSGNSATQAAGLLQAYQLAGVRPAPYGVELFCGGNVTASTVGVVDPGYIIKTGDQISINLWGSVPDASQTVTVDTNGNVIVPGVGPVKVGGLPAGQVNKVVQAAAAVVYRNAVHIYAAPVTTVPITVFITGGAVAPGPYAGLGSDSVLAFLQRAGGIDANRGSYRNISVRRGGKVIAHIDLYPFLRNGEMQPVSLQNGDTIVVGQQGPVVAVTGAVRAPYTFELAGPTSTGEEVLYYARPRPEVNYAAVLGYRNAQPMNIYETLGDFAHQALVDGDRVGFSADSLADTLVVQVAGAFHGPGAYVVTRDTTVGAVLAKIQLDGQADQRWIHIQRASVAAAQKQLLTESLARLQKAIYTQPAPTAALVAANAAQATTIQTYITYANQIQPVGDVAFSGRDDLSRVALEPNDVIVIPFKSQVVTVGGNVNVPQSFIYEPGLTARDYVKKAGGFDALGERGHIMVIHPDGSLVINGAVQPGDRVLVGVRLSGHFLDVASALTAIIYQLAVGALTVTKF